MPSVVSFLLLILACHVQDSVCLIASNIEIDLFLDIFITISATSQLHLLELLLCKTFNEYVKL